MGTRNKAIQSGCGVSHGKPVKIPVGLQQLIRAAPKRYTSSYRPFSPLEDAVLIEFAKNHVPRHHMLKIFKDSPDLRSRAHDNLRERMKQLGVYEEWKARD